MRNFIEKYQLHNKLNILLTKINLAIISSCNFMNYPHNPVLFFNKKHEGSPLPILQSYTLRSIGPSDRFIKSFKLFPLKKKKPMQLKPSTHAKE